MRYIIIALLLAACGSSSGTTPVPVLFTADALTGTWRATIMQEGYPYVRVALFELTEYVNGNVTGIATLDADQIRIEGQRGPVSYTFDLYQGSMRFYGAVHWDGPYLQGAYAGGTMDDRYSFRATRLD